MITQTRVPEEIQERWFVYDPDNHLQIFTTEKAAHDKFQEIIQLYRDEAAGDEWPDDVEEVTWGKVFQTVVLVPIDDPRDPEDIPANDDGTDFAEAFALEHRQTRPSKKCPECGNVLISDSEYPNDLLCGHCNKVFDGTTLKFVEVF